MPDDPIGPAWGLLSDDLAGTWLAQFLGGDPLPVRAATPAPHAAWPWPGIECYLIDHTRFAAHRLLALAGQIARAGGKTTGEALAMLAEGYPVPAGYVAEVYTGPDPSGVLVSCPSRRARIPEPSAN